MQRTPSLMVLDLDGGSVLPAQAVAGLLGLAQPETITGAEQALAALRAKKPAPNYVLLDLGKRGQEALDLVSQLVRAAQGASRFIAIGHANDLTFYRMLKMAGVDEYFTHPARPEELAGALAHTADAAKQMASPSAPHTPGKVIGVVSAASGDGGSTVALNVAYAIANELKLPTVLVDMDYQFGMQARHLDLQPQFGIREVLDFPERGVDANLIGKMLLPYGDRLRLIAAPDSLRPLPAIRPETVRTLVEVLTAQFGCVVLDMPHLWMPWTAEALRLCDSIVVVSQMWLRSLAHLSRMQSAWQEAGLSRSRMQLTLNRSGARYREAITPQDFERVCGTPIRFHLANDMRTVVEAENQGKTVVEIGGSQLERQLRDMGRELMGAGAAAASEQEGSFRNFKRLLKR